MTKEKIKVETPFKKESEFYKLWKSSKVDFAKLINLNLQPWQRKILKLITQNKQFLLSAPRRFGMHTISNVIKEILGGKIEFIKFDKDTEEKELLGQNITRMFEKRI